MLGKIRFQLLRLSVHFFVFLKWLTNNSWKKVEGVYLPFSLNIGFSTLRWILNGKYEQGEISIIKAKLEKSDTVLEIGTGLGFVSTFCAKKIGSENVFTFEANPLNIETAKKVFHKNNVTPVLKNVLLDNEIGTIQFSVDKKNRLASSIFADKDNFVSVEKVLLNQTIATLKPSFLIMDIEGAEYDIFRIIEFQTINKIQFELHPSILGEAKCDEIFSILNKNNFLIDKSISDERNFYFEKGLN